MRSKLTLMTTAAVLALGLSGAAYAADTGTPRGDGIKESEASEATTQKTHKDGSMSGAGSMQGGGDNSSDQGGTGVKASSDSEGATNKSTDDGGAMGMNEGKSSGNAPGGTGVETSAGSEGAKNKTSNE